jgi:hypothetical protein
VKALFFSYTVDFVVISELLKELDHHYFSGKNGFPFGLGNFRNISILT